MGGVQSPFSNVVEDGLVAACPLDNVGEDGLSLVLCPLGQAGCSSAVDLVVVLCPQNSQQSRAFTPHLSQVVVTQFVEFFDF